jgi:hypothetical protein
MKTKKNDIYIFRRGGKPQVLPPKFEVLPSLEIEEIKYSSIVAAHKPR